MSKKKTVATEVILAVEKSGELPPVAYISLLPGDAKELRDLIEVARKLPAFTGNSRLDYMCLRSDLKPRFHHPRVVCAPRWFDEDGQDPFERLGSDVIVRGTNDNDVPWSLILDFEEETPGTIELLVTPLGVTWRCVDDWHGVSIIYETAPLTAELLETITDN